MQFWNQRSQAAFSSWLDITRFLTLAHKMYAYCRNWYYISVALYRTPSFNRVLTFCSDCTYSTPQANKEFSHKHAVTEMCWTFFSPTPEFPPTTSVSWDGVPELSLINGTAEREFRIWVLGSIRAFIKFLWLRPSVELFIYVSRSPAILMVIEIGSDSIPVQSALDCLICPSHMK